MPNIEQIVSSLELLADTARLVGDDRLAALITEAVTAYNAGESDVVAPMTETLYMRPQVQTPEVVLVDNDLTVEELGLAAQTVEDQNRQQIAAPVLPDEDDFDLEGFGDEVDEAMMDGVLPRHIDLHANGEDFNASRGQIVEAVDLALAAMKQVLRAEGLTAGMPEELGQGRWLIRVSADDMSAREALSRLGAAKDGFNAAPHIGVGYVNITSLVGDVDDAEAAADMGIRPVDLPEVPEGQHEINGAVTVAQEAYGINVVPAHVVLTYTHTGGVLTADQARGIMLSPVSQHPTMGLPRFGTLYYDGAEITDGDTPASKKVRIPIIANGEVNAATMHEAVALASGAATVYAGQHPFPELGLGVVDCASAVDLVNDPAVNPLI